MPVVFVTGLPCSGKTTYANANFDRVVHLDALKFGPGWQRVSADVVTAEMRRLADPNALVAFEGSFHDPTDSVTQDFIEELMKTGQLAGVVCFRPPATVLEQATRIMTRSFNRLLGTCAQNESGNIERPVNVARMMQKTFGHFDVCCAWLNALCQQCEENNIPFEWRTSSAVEQPIDGG